MAIQYGFSSTPRRTVSLRYVQRIAENYARSVSKFDGYGHSMWGGFSQQQASVVEAINNNDMTALSFLLGNPSETDFLWGYDDLVKTFTDARMNTSAEILEQSARDLYVALVQVSIGIGAFNIPNVEANQSFPEVAVEEVLQAIDSVFGFKIEFPDCYAFRWGLVTERGIADYRSIQSIYQAWRTTQLAAAVGAGSVLEIGAGLGRNAYYAMRLGLPAYTIIDIPTTQIAQGHYLGLILGEDNVSLDDSEGSRPIRIRSPRWLRHTNEKFDVVVNADSLTEMDIGNSKEYIRYSSNNSRIFVSFNHEFNGHTVNELLKDASAKVLSRAPYWPRPGYVEEIAIFGGH